MLLFFRYKERLQTKYVKTKNPRDTSKFLIGKNWTFTKDGLDDFRDGLPPPQSDGDLLKVFIRFIKVDFYKRFHFPVLFGCVHVSK